MYRLNKKYYYTFQLVTNGILGEYNNDGIGAIRVATPVSKEIKSGKSIVFLWKKGVDVKNATFENIRKDMNNIAYQIKYFFKD